MWKGYKFKREFKDWALATITDEGKLEIPTQGTTKRLGDGQSSKQSGRRLNILSKSLEESAEPNQDIRKFCGIMLIESALVRTI